MKNIAEPVRVWRVRLEESDSPGSGVRSPASKGEGRKARRVSFARRHWAMVVGLVLIAGTTVVVWYLSLPKLSTQDSGLKPRYT